MSFLNICVKVTFAADGWLFLPFILGTILRFRGIDRYIIGDNVPYKGELKDDTLYKHGLKKNILHTLIEVRNDLINTEIKVNKMSQFIVNSLKTINKELSL